MAGSVRRGSDILTRHPTYIAALVGFFALLSVSLLTTASGWLPVQKVDLKFRVNLNDSTRMLMYVGGAAAFGYSLRLIQIGWKKHGLTK
eukprot:789755_1